MSSNILFHQEKLISNVSAHNGAFLKDTSWLHTQLGFIIDHGLNSCHANTKNKTQLSKMRHPGTANKNTKKYKLWKNNKKPKKSLYQIAVFLIFGYR